jgi:hypothetical protein
MTRRAYYRLCANQPRYWLERCANDPGPYMRPRHVALIRLALRNGDCLEP